MQFVLNLLPRDPMNIQYLPCKDIKIVPEKSDESKFLFWVEDVTDSELLVGCWGQPQPHCLLSPWFPSAYCPPSNR
jgi:hypothetical protein